MAHRQMTTTFRLNPAEVIAATASLPPRDRLAYLLACRGLCARSLEGC